MAMANRICILVSLAWTLEWAAGRTNYAVTDMALRVLFFLLAGLAWGQIAPLTDDSYTADDAGDAAFGAQERMLVDGRRQGLVRFQLPVAPAGQLLQSATLTLFANQVVRAGTIQVTALGGRWAEATVTRRTLPSTTGPTATNIAVERGQSYIAVDVTRLVRTWLEGAANHGLLITAGAAGTSVVFDTKENTGTSHPAQLELEWVSGGTPGARGPAGPAGPMGPKGEPGPAGPSAAERWAATGTAIDLRRMALRRWGAERTPLLRIPYVFTTVLPPPAGALAIENFDRPLGLETDGEAMYLLMTRSLLKFRAVDGFMEWNKTFSGLHDKEWLTGSTILFDGGYLWRVGPSLLAQVLPGTGDGIGTALMEDQPKVIAFDGAGLWIAMSSGLRRIALPGWVLTQEPPTLGSNTELGAASALAWDGVGMWAATPATGEVYRLAADATVMEKQAVCPPGNAMPGMVFDGTALWISCGASGMVARLRVAQGGADLRLRQIDAGGGTSLLEFDGATIWAIRTNETGPLFVRISLDGETVVPVSWPGFSQPQLIRFDGQYLWSLLRSETPGQPSGALVKF